MNKYEVARRIGEFFGDASVVDPENGVYFIDNGDVEYHYKSVEDMLEDWVETLVEASENPSCGPYGTDSWEKEILFIYEEVLKKYPTGVRPVRTGKGGTLWSASMDICLPDAGAHGKNFHLGSWPTIVGAIHARWNFEQLVKSCDDTTDAVMLLAKSFQLHAKGERSKARNTSSVHSCMMACLKKYGVSDEKLSEAAKEVLRIAEKH